RWRRRAARGGGARKARNAGKVAKSSDPLVGALKDGMTIGIGGFGLDRKPMALVRAIARSSVRDLTIETYAGGFDIEVLLAADKIKCISSCHVGPHHFCLPPPFPPPNPTPPISLRACSALSP